MNQKDRDRLTIRQQICEFLSRGGKIATVPFGESGEEFIPKRAKRDQIIWRKRRNTVTRG